MKWEIFRKAAAVFLVLAGWHVQSQDLFDYKNSKSFADYLYRTKRYDLSAREYQRILFLKPTDTSSWINLVRSYHFQQNFSQALSFLDSAEASLGINDKRLGMLRAYSYLKTSDDNKLSNTLEKYQYSQGERKLLVAANNALKGNWSYFQNFPETDDYWLNNFKSMADEIREDKSKSPFLAGLLSSIIPGSGKIYTKRGKDGLFSFALVGTSAWQASRLISRKGIANVGSIFFTGFAAGLYAGNIYGSVKTAKDYNDRLKIKNYERSSDLVDLYFGY